MELPQSMLYAMKRVPTVKSSAILRSFGASNGTTFDVSTNEIRIPVNCDGFLDGHRSYLYFTIKNNEAAGANAPSLAMDPYGLCWCDQIRLEANGQVLERVERAGVYDALRRRWTGGQKAIPRNSAVAGGGEGLIPIPNTGVSVAATASLSLSCDLPLGFLKTHNKVAVPKGASFDIVIRVNSTAAQCFKYTNGVAAFTINNPRFYAPVYQIEDGNVMDDYASALSERGIMWSGDTVKSYVNSITAAAGVKTLQINDRSNSLKGLITVLRDNTTVADAASNSVGHSTIEGVLEVRTSIAGRNYPADNISVNTLTDSLDVARLYTECSKVLAPEGQLECDPAVIKSSFADNTPTSAQGVIAVDLKKFSDDGKLSMVGLDTASNNSPSTIELTTDANALACEAVTYALAEANWMLDGRGQLSVSM